MRKYFVVNTICVRDMKGGEAVAERSKAECSNEVSTKCVRNLQ